MDSKQFAQNYGKVVAKVWSDPAFIGQLNASPASVLSKNGIDTKAGAKINVVQVKSTGNGKVEDQVADWAAGDKSGVYNLWIPLKPSDLGGAAAADDTSTTCTPCTTCT